MHLLWFKPEHSVIRHMHLPAVGVSFCLGSYLNAITSVVDMEKSIFKNAFTVLSKFHNRFEQRLNCLC